MYDDSSMRPKTVAEKCERLRELRSLNEPQMSERWRVRDIMNNREAFAALVGPKIKDKSLRLPIANLMQRADTVLGQKLGREPDVKVDPPASNDTDLARNRADRRARTVRWLDEECDLPGQLPQVGRWVPGYGFTAAVVKQRISRSKQPVPVIELRDPIQTFPGEWGVNQQPFDMGVEHLMGRDRLCKMFPDHATTLKSRSYDRASGGGVILGQTQSPSWANQAGGGVVVYEYHDEQGCWWLVPEYDLCLTVAPNVVKDDVQFRLVKRYAFDELTGQYDSAIGVMANMAWLALMATIATEDGVMAETNIFGDLKSNGGQYSRGRKAVNILTTGSTVERGSTRVPFETFSQIDRIERQLRILMGHTPQDDGEQQGGWATGRGLEQLATSGGAEVKEYQTAFRRWLRDLDSLRLEYLERAYPDREFTINGQHQGARFSEQMVPSRDIGGDYVTRREYGAMAAFDDASMIVAGTALLQAEVIDTDTLRENMSNLGDHQKIKGRIRSEKAEKVVFDTMFAMAQQGEQKALTAAIRMMEAGDMRSIAEEVFLAEEEAPAAAIPEPQAPPPDVTTMMTRLTPSGATGGVQTVGRI